MSSRRDTARSTKPIPCYSVDQIPPKTGSSKLYDELALVVSDGTASLLEELEIPPRDARSWKVPAGCLWRIICTKGPQVADMNCWSIDSNYEEHFYSSKTRQIHRTHLTTGDRLWSNMKFVRPLATIVRDTIAYGFDQDGAGVHDVIGSRCDPYTNFLMTKTDMNCCCHSNLTRQALRDGLTEEHVHDVLNVFMCTGFMKGTQQYFTKPSPVEVGDYLEFLAETDLLVSASTCPQGDVSVACGSSEEPVCYPLGVQIWKPDRSWMEREGWKPSSTNGYSGNHGLNKNSGN